ncbi:sigma-70 family RNA polymerase sigma factor [Streptomyces sp. NPDC088745]|uniref:sigma-70 family RNA polymerase sigma factor n=1 Tax=Streptomyces sp. NPDC088745 TaxID=3365884 RepID=UPI00381DD7FA
MAAGTTPLAPERAHAHHVVPDTDCDAFVRDIYDRYGSLILQYATRQLDGDWHKAQDILQETAARAWKHARFLRTRREHIRPWLYTVARNLVIDHHRGQQIRSLEFMPAEDLDTSRDTTESSITSHAVLEALRQLNEQQRAVIRLMYSLECSVAQAAEHLWHTAGHRQEPRLLRRARAARGAGEARCAREVAAAAR